MKRFTIVLAAATAVGGMSFSSVAWATAAQASESVGKSPAVASLRNAPVPDHGSVDQFLATLTQNALTRGGFDQLVSQFTSTVQAKVERSNTFSQDDGNALDQKVQQIDQAWKQKYGHGFDVSRAEQALGQQFAQVQQGTPNTNPKLAKEVYGSEQQQSLQQQESAALDTQKMVTAAETTGPLNRPIALVALNGSGSEPAIRVPLIRNADGEWRLKAPGTLDASTLRQDLLNHLTKLASDSGNWPTDEAQAYRAAARCVLSAVVQTPAPAHQSSPSNQGKSS